MQQNKVNTGELSAISGSVVLDPAIALPLTKTKYLAIYAIVGLIVGVVLGMVIVVVRTIVSDRLRRRDDVATAMGVPVRLSVQSVPLSRWRPGRRGLSAARLPAVRRITAYLRTALPRAGNRTAALAVIPVDEPQVAALSLVSLAVSCAQEGRSVVVADLAEGAPAGRPAARQGTGCPPGHGQRHAADPGRPAARRPGPGRAGRPGLG